MWPFRKKQKAQEAPSPTPHPPCKHKWQDFPWIMKFYWYNDGRFIVDIIEPYVCIYCKKRQDKQLTRDVYTNTSAAFREKTMAEYKAKYKDRVLPEAEVEDQISDFQLVDREWLEIASMLKRSRNA